MGLTDTPSNLFSTVLKNTDCEPLKYKLEEKVNKKLKNGTKTYDYQTIKLADEAKFKRYVPCDKLLLLRKTM